jgi:hypothetical protein
MRHPILLASLAALASLPGSSASLTSGVREHNGAPALYVNGRLTSQVLAAPYRPGTADFTDFLQAGQSIFDIYLRFRWTAPEEYDFSGIDQIMDAYLKLEPKALFLPRILLSPGNWWCKEFPNDFTMRDYGTPAGMFGQQPPCYPSLSSARYRDLSHKAVTAFIHHVESKYGDNIVGYQVGNGFGGEWLMFNSFWEIRPGGTPPTKFGVEDYSPVARAGFRAWLQKKYATIEALRRAWGDAKVTFETATPPNEVERYTSTHGIFFDPGVSSRVPDFFSWFNDTVADALIENAQWVKELTGRQKIVGAFYGYLWCNFPNLSVNHTGHLGLAKVLRAPDVDFIASPYTYDNKQIGGPNNSQTLPAAVALHGKLYFNEVDTETHLHQREWRWGNSLNNPKTFEETAGLLTRDYAYALTNSFGMWWTDLHGGTYHDDQIVGLVRQLKQLDEKSLEFDRRPSAEIAVVLDEESFKYCGDGEPLFNAVLTAQKQWELAFIGAPWDAQLLSDMGNPKLRDYKLYVFLNTWRVTAGQRDAIHARLKRNGATAVWVYAPGYIGDKVSVENMRALTGITLAENNSAGELHVDVTSYDHAYTKGLAKSFAYGTDVNVENIKRWYDHQVYLKDPRDPGLQRDLPGFRVNPRFYADDPQAQVLGKLAGVDKPGLVVKPQQGWTSVYSAAPILPAALLRNIARAAGVQIYSDAGDVVYADRNYLAIYAPGGGTRTVRLPGKSRVTDALTGKLIAEAAGEFPLAMQPNSTVILRVEGAGNQAVLPSFHAEKDVEPSADPDSPFWKDLPGAVIDHSVLGPEMPQFRAEVRSRWTRDYVYFLFAGVYQMLTLKPNPDLKNETFHLWDKDCFEVYLGADFEHTNRYREFQMSPQGEFLDLDIDSTRPRPGFNGENLWNSGMQVKARVDPVRKIWYGEMKIPIAAVDARPAKEGNEMRINLYRQDGENPNRDFLAWQPPGIWNPHHPEKFGTLRLVTSPATR